MSEVPTHEEANRTESSPEPTVDPSGNGESDADTAAPDADFEFLLSFLRESRGFDFTGYKRASLVRRIDKRMSDAGVVGYRAYVDFLEVHPEEFAALFNTILINVTSFFRDPPAWELIARDALPGILGNKGEDEPVRVWSAACASGEEAFTLAILLAEALGLDAFARRVKIYATDVDDEALQTARQAVYSRQALVAVPEPLRQKYFVPHHGGFAFRHDLRRAVIFGKHNLVTDAAISKLDLLVCRNALMYFNQELQDGILRRFHFALRDDGYLLLGRAEMLLAHSALFEPVDLRQRVFRKLLAENLRQRVPKSATEEDRRAPVGAASVSKMHQVKDLTFETQPEGQFVVDRSGVLVMANRVVREQLAIRPSDLGRPFHDLEVSFRPLELRSLIEKACQTNQPVNVEEVTQRTADGHTRAFDVKIVPLTESERLLGVSVTFIDVTKYRDLDLRLQRATHELETATEELNSSNEELETTNEELQSTVEELETTNEELQSANEELETMNEELQAANQEMEAVNLELRLRGEEADRANLFLESVLRSLRAGVAVVDRDLRVTSWNDQAEDLWGIRASEVEGESLLTLDIGLPLLPLVEPLRQCMEDADEQRELVLDAVNRRGRAFRCRVMMSPLRDRNLNREGAIVLMERWDRHELANAGD